MTASPRPDTVLDGWDLSPDLERLDALVVGPLAAALRQDGAHGYRTLLTRAGAACEAAWLSAVRDGLSGSIFAGFLPSALRDTAGIDGCNHTQLLALALGHTAH